MRATLVEKEHKTLLPVAKKFDQRYFPREIPSSASNVTPSTVTNAILIPAANAISYSHQTPPFRPQLVPGGGRTKGCRVKFGSGAGWRWQYIERGKR